MKAQIKDLPELKKVIALADRFDEIQSDEAKGAAIIMLVTGFFLESVREECYEEYLKSMADDVLSNIKAFKEYQENELAEMETHGNA